MKMVPLAIGVAAGLLLGWAGMRLLAMPDGGATTQKSAPRGGHRATGDGLWQWIRERGDPLEVRSREEFLKAREANRGGADRSPYRGDALELSWLATMPLSEVLDLLEGGELESAEQARVAFARWVEVDPEAALESLDRMMNRDWRRVAQGVVYGHWARTNPEGLLAKLAAGEPSMERERKARALLAAWGEENPQQALASAGELSGLFARPSEQLSRIRDELLAAWLAQDEDAPFEWVEAHPDGEEREGLVNALVTARLKQSGTVEAVRYILNHPAEEGLQNRLGEYWRDWSRSDPTGALAGMRMLPEGHRFWDAYAGTVAQSAMVMAMLTERTDEAVAVLDQIPEGERRRKVLLGMVQGAASNDSALAQELIERLPESPEREQAASFMIELWARNDIPAAGEWLRNQEPSESRDVATSRFALTLCGEDPALAAEWAETIARDGLRRQTRASLYERWRETDAEGAEEWRRNWPDE